MPKIILIIALFFSELILISTTPSTTFASACDIKYSPTPLVEHFPPLTDKDPETGSNVDPKTQRINFEVTVSDKSPSQKYRIVFDRGGFSISLNDTVRKPVYVDNLTPDSSGILKTASGDLPYLQYNSSTQASLFSPGTHTVAIERVGVENQVYCQCNYAIQSDKENALLACDLTIKPATPTESDEITVDGTFTVNKNTKLASTAYLNLKGVSIDLQGTVIFQRVRSDGLFQKKKKKKKIKKKRGLGGLVILKKKNDQIQTVNFGKLPPGEYRLVFRNASD